MEAMAILISAHVVWADLQRNFISSSCFFFF